MDVALCIGAALAAVILGMAIFKMGPSGRALGKPGILRLQFARTAAAVDELKQTWGPARIAAAKENTRWDFLLIIGYTSLLSLLGLLLHQSAAANLGWAPPALALVAIPALAGLCDSLENVLTLRMLTKQPTNTEALATTLLATTKWLCLVLAVAWIAVVLVSEVVRQIG